VGNLHYSPNNSLPGSYVELRAEMNVLVLLNTCQHPLAPGNEYAPRPVEVSIARVAPVRTNDPCRTLCSENTRGFLLTELFFL
jgi:uncharacterized protein YcgI (DUF1989 family)